MPFCTPRELEELWSAVDLADVNVDSVVVAADYDGFEDLWQPLELDELATARGTGQRHRRDRTGRVASAGASDAQAA